MDPLTLGVGIVGLGLQIWGASESSENAQRAAALSRQQAGLEQDINEQKKLQMQFEANRMQLQQYRNIQRLRAQGTAAAVNQGAASGSGLQGGLAATTASGLTNVTGILGNLQFGNTIFGLNNQISNVKMQMADVQADQAESQAWASLGGSLVNNAGTIGALGQNVGAGFRNAQLGNSFFGGGSPSGYGRA